MGRRTFEADVYFLSQPRVDPIGGRVFGNGVLFNPPATGERVEVVAGVNGPIDLTENGPGWKEATLKHSEWRDAMAAAAAADAHLLRCIRGSGRTPPGWIFGRLKHNKRGRSW